MRANEAKERALSANALREILTYNPQSGFFVRKTMVGSRGAVGQIVGSLHHSGYLHVWIGKYQYLLHRLVWLWMTGDWPVEQIDHINGDKSDNRWSNLRAATHGQNKRNSRLSKNSTSGYVGVSYFRSNRRWYSYLTLNGKKVFVGFFKNAIDAAACRNVHSAYLCDSFARLNDMSNYSHD
jgi:HNH endonuclease